MAIDNDSYFSNSIPGAMTVGADANIFQVDSAPKLAVGTKIERQDGCVYRYAHIGSATAVGMVVAPDQNGSARAYSANCLIITSSAFQQDMELTGVYPGGLESKFIAAVIGAPAAGYYAGGYITINSGNGAGYTYRIKGNQAASGTATVIELYDKIKVALSSVGNIIIGPSKYANLMGAMAVNTQNSIPVGVLCSAVASTSSYAWICTKGIATVKQSGTLVTGKFASLSNTDVGHVEPYGNGATTETGSAFVTLTDIPKVGFVYQAGANSMHALVDVMLE